ncbi:MAG: hypothetical protein KBC98_00010 [Candidatus Pacebacteria bacterium]|nr:hypothetical protein [Candidatus Paceibacterota bacterium]
MIRNPIDLYTKSFLPSRKLRIILGIIIGIAILVWLVPHVWVWIRTPGAGKKLPEPINPTVATPTDSYLDSDDDGIPDWKEQFIRTYGIATSNEEGGPTDGSITGTLTLLDTIPDTQKISLEIAARLGDGAASNESAAQVTQQAVKEYIDSLSASLRTYSLYDIEMGDTDTLSDEKAYAIKMDPLLETKNFFSSERVQLITRIYTQSEDKITLANLQKDIGNVIKDLLATSVPPNATSLHLQYTNSLFALHQLLNISIDPNDSVKNYAVYSLVQKEIYNISLMPITFSQYFFVTLDPNLYSGV